MGEDDINLHQVAWVSGFVPEIDALLEAGHSLLFLSKETGTARSIPRWTPKYSSSILCTTCGNTFMSRQLRYEPALNLNNPCRGIASGHFEVESGVSARSYAQMRDEWACAATGDPQNAADVDRDA